jgi:hypothetical protein
MSAPRELHPRPKFLGALVLVVLGVADRRAGRGYRSAYSTWDIDGQWNYERGRAWAVLPSSSSALFIGSTSKPHPFTLAQRPIKGSRDAFSSVVSSCAISVSQRSKSSRIASWPPWLNSTAIQSSTPFGSYKLDQVA